METIERKLSPELEAQLREYKGYTDDAEFLWTPELYRENEDSIPKSEWPIFKIKGRDGIDAAEAEDNLGYTNQNGKVFTNSGALRIQTLRKHILGWKNFYDKNNQEIKFMSGSDGVSEKLIRKIPQGLQAELYAAIIEQSTLSEKELEGLKF